MHGGQGVMEGGSSEVILIPLWLFGLGVSISLNWIYRIRSIRGPLKSLLLRDKKLAPKWQQQVG